MAKANVLEFSRKEGSENRTMTLSTSFLALLVLSTFVTVLLCTSSESSGGTCQDKLVGNSYDCTYAFNFGQSGIGVGFITKHNCVEFVTGGLSENFDLVGVLGSLASEFGCACQTTGGLDARSLHISANAYECVGGSSGNVVQFHGKIDSNRLHGQASEENGAYIVFDCKKLSTACM